MEWLALYYDFFNSLFAFTWQPQPPPPPLPQAFVTHFLVFDVFYGTR